MAGESKEPLTVVRTVGELRLLTRRARREGKVVGFVPTMGALHRGHLRLVEVAGAKAELVVVSIFVNPTQFGPGEDLEQYPRDLEGDMGKCAAAGAHVIYAPGVGEIYPDGYATSVHVSGLTEALCGRHRPGHFDGVATVVTKLFNQIGPCVAVFGRKDYQQYTMIRRLVRDLDQDVEVIGVPTVREPDGLALSSRNAYLTAEERPRALALVQGLAAAWTIADSREPCTVGQLVAAARAPLDAAFDSVDYVEVCDPDRIEPWEAERVVEGPALLAVAGRLGATRLIDNVVLREQPNPLPA